jgi:hypothetical protein
VNGPTVVNAQLTATSFPLTITTNVRGAAIFVDNAQISGNVVNVSQGAHTVKVTAKGYQDYVTTVDVSGPVAINAQLVVMGYALSVTSNVQGASVFINNVEKGQTPYSEVLPPGPYTVLVSAPGYVSYTTSVNLNGPISVNARLSEARPAIVNLVLPKGLVDQHGREFNQIKVFIDGKQVNVKRDLTGIPVAAGRHKIAVSSGDLYVESESIDFAGGATYTIELIMELRVNNPR